METFAEVAKNLCKQKNKTSQNYNENSIALLYQKGDVENMQGITLRKDGRYMIRKTQNGIRRTFYARTLKEAKHLLSKIKKNQLEKHLEKIKAISVGEWISQWVDTYKKPFIKERTLKDLNILMAKIKAAFEKIPLNELTTFQIQNFFNKIEANRTKERLTIYFNALLEKATDLDLINKNPFKAVVKDKKKKYKNECFNIQEQEKLINAIKGTDIEQDIYIYLLTGCRPAEKPEVEDIDLKNNVIYIRGTKTEKSKLREIEITEEFKNYLTPFVVSNNFHSKDYTRKQFNKICTMCKIDKAILYRLRHTFASNHFILGTPAKQVAEWMGHASVKITLDIYTDIDKRATKEKIQKIYNNFYFIRK